MEMEGIILYYCDLKILKLKRIPALTVSKGVSSDIYYDPIETATMYQRI